MATGYLLVKHKNAATYGIRQNGIRKKKKKTAADQNPKPALWALTFTVKDK